MTTGDSMSSVARECPNCGYPIPPGRVTLCPNCRHSLILDEEDDQLETTAGPELQKPTYRSESTDTTIPAPVSAPPEPEAVQGVVCKACGYVNTPTQVRCERCATLLKEKPAATPPPSEPPAPSPRRNGRLVLLIVGALVLALVLGSAAYLVMRRPWSGGSEASPSVSQPSSTQPAKLRRVSKKAIKARASSTLPPDIYTHGVTNTIDGTPKTAWNSNGNAVGAFAKVTLTYTFSSPIQLRAIEIYNGYQRSTESFRDNSRVSRLLIWTDTTKHRVKLRDKPGKQTISFDFGQTKRVVLTVETVYRESNTKFKDCAISEVAFLSS
jgi:hypothetical protein